MWGLTSGSHEGGSFASAFCSLQLLSLAGSLRVVLVFRTPPVRRAGRGAAHSMCCSLISLLPCPNRTLLTRHLCGSLLGLGRGAPSSQLSRTSHSSHLCSILPSGVFTHIFPSMPPQKDLNPVYKSPPLCTAISHLCSPLSPQQPPVLPWRCCSQLSLQTSSM